MNTLQSMLPRFEEGQVKKIKRFLILAYFLLQGPLIFFFKLANMFRSNYVLLPTKIVATGDRRQPPEKTASAKLEEI